MAWTQSAPHPLQVGNHRVDTASGEIAMQDDGRARLPAQVTQTRRRLSTCWCTRRRAEKYRLRLGVVQEEVAWLAEIGNVPYEAIEALVQEYGPLLPARTNGE